MPIFLLEGEMQDHHDEGPSQPQDEPPTPASAGEAEKPSEGVRRRVRARALRIGAAGTVVAVAVAAAAIAASDGASSVQPASRHGSTTAHAINALLAGIPQNGNTLGSPTAPVTLQYFGDLECSTARAFTLETLPSIIRKWVRPGELRIEYRSLRSVSEPEMFGVQQVAALAAGMQDKLWYYIENFYHEQGREHSGYVTDSYLSALARQVPGLNFELWADDRHDPQLAPQVAQDEQTAHGASLYSTPSLLVGRTGSAPLHSFDQFTALDLGAVDKAVRQALHNQPAHGHRAPPTVTPAASARSPQHTTSIARRDRPSTGTEVRSKPHQRHTRKPRVQ